MYVQTGKGSSSGGNIIQDNIDIVKFITIDDFVLGNTTIQEVAARYNNLPNFTVNDKQTVNVVAYILNTDGFATNVITYKIVDVGMGTYGIGGTPIDSSNLLFLSNTSPTISDIEKNPLTQVITIEDLDGLNVSEYFNQMDALELQDISIAPRLVKTPVADYLFLAVGGTYGAGELQTTISDFQLLNENATDSDLEIKITDFSQLTNTELRSDKIYVLQNDLEQTSLDSIIVDGDLTIVSGGYDTVTIKSNIPNAILFKSAVGGSGNFRLKGLSIANTGIGSKAFDLVDKNLTAHEIGFNNVNFSDCVSLGKIRNFRQVIGDDVGFYGLQDGLIYSGANNGLKFTNFNGFGWNPACTLIKKDDDTTFANRLFISGNLAVPSGAILCDFISDNLLANELLQINSSQIKVNGVINPDLGKDLVPNLSANDLKCKWTGNSGIPNSAIQTFVEDTDVSEYFEIDWLKDTYLLTMTGDTVFTETNLPANGKNTQTINIALRGDFVPQFPEHWETNLVGTYVGSGLNNITVKFIKEETYIMKIDNKLLVYPKPSLQNLVPTSLLPSNTASLTINGSFFTPETIVKIENQTVNSVEFINQGQLILSVTTSAVEEEVDITISNGTTVIFSGILPINLGTVFIPSEPNWTEIIAGLNVSENGSAKITVFNGLAESTWNQEFDYTKDYIVQFRVIKSPLVSPTNAGDTNRQFRLLNSTTNAELFNFWIQDITLSMIPYVFGKVTSLTIANEQIMTEFDSTLFWDTKDYKYEFRFVGGIMRFYIDNILKWTFADTLTTNLKLDINIKSFNVKDIKYIELP